MIRRLALARRPRRAPGRCRAPAVTKPGHLGVGGVDSSRSMPSSPSRAKPPRSVSRPSSGSWSILKSPVCRTSPAGGADGDGERVGDRVVDREELAVERAELLALALARPRACTGLIRCSRSLASTSARVSREPTSGMSGFSRSRYGTRADVVLVPVGEHDRRRCRRAGPGSTPKSGRIRSTPGWSASGNSTPQSTTSSWPSNSRTVMLRPISPSPPSAMTRRPPSGSGGGAAELRVRLAHRLASPRRHAGAGAQRRAQRAVDGPAAQSLGSGRAALAAARSLSWASLGARPGARPTGRPERQRGLDHDHALGPEDAGDRRAAASGGSRGPARGRRRRRRRRARASRRRRGAPTTLTTPTAPSASSGRFSMSSPE